MPTLTVQPSDKGKRLDAYLHERLPEYSRARIQAWIKEGRVLTNQQPARASQILKGSEAIELNPGDLPPLHADPEAIPLTILYEDDHLIAIDKPAGMVVHAGAGIHSGTLVNALLHRFQTLSSVNGPLRPGIVHRLDRFTSGVLLVAKTDAAHQKLAAQFAARQVRKEYLTMVHGSMPKDQARIEKPIARDPRHRARMTSKLAEGRAAWSEYRVLERFPKLTYLSVIIGTGRTHQIRVHLAGIGHPVVGDILYGAPPNSGLDRYFLHAHRIQFAHPSTGDPIQIESELAPELRLWKETQAL